MNQKFTEFKQLNLSEIAKGILATWKTEKTFQKSIDSRPAEKLFVFYEGPPSANGKPGIHHVMARTIKDLFCRYKTLKGYRVERKAGWDTHGLPIELGVEKELGITKEDIGKSITIEAYNDACKKAVMRYTDLWAELTEKMGYWVNMDDPYITYQSKYMESVWYLLKMLFDKNLLYKGYTIQPYSPKAGTGLSTHELNQPGTYRDVTDTSVTALFELDKDSVTKLNLKEAHGPVKIIAWTTTPWTLPSNTALAVGKKISYSALNTFNPYTGSKCTVILATDLIGKYFNNDHEEDPVSYKAGDKKLPWKKISEFKGSELIDHKYLQLLPYAKPYKNAENAFKIIEGDFVSTEDGTGIVHIAPTFGADDARVAKVAGVPAMLVLNDEGDPVPLVDLQGRFTKHMGVHAGKYVKNEYYADDKLPDKSVDVELAIQLKEEDKAFKVEKYVHSYPHCWRTDKPILYYPLDSWFIKSTKAKLKMVELNKTINWKPESTGTGRFGNWLENLNDWNLSRSRFWGTPIPIWRSEDGKEIKCIGSIEELKNEIELSVEKGVMNENRISGFEPGNMSEENYAMVDLHKQFVDTIKLVSESGQILHHEEDLIDVWFDSGAMPYAQYHYPFENKKLIDEGKFFPADYIAEGVDQTRGWFFTLHAIASMCFNSVAYKNVISNGLVLDKKGQKMSKRLGNAVNPFEILEKYGPDATRWYLITNAQPWDNLKFDEEGIAEVQRKFFGTFHNTYAFFALYANVDKFRFEEDKIDYSERPELDRWILSKLNSLISEVTAYYDDYEPTKAGRSIQEFVTTNLSNWYVRLSRRRFWKGDYTKDKIAAYQTLYQCLETTALLAAPIAPFYCDRIYRDLNGVRKGAEQSVHLSDFPKSDKEQIDKALEDRMELAQKFSSLVLSLRKKERIKVRQPLQRIMIPVLNTKFKENVMAVKDLILSEVNVKEMELLEDTSGILVKSIKPNFKILGPKYQKQMKSIVTAINQLTAEDIRIIENKGAINLPLENENINLLMEDVEVHTDDIPGWLVASEGGYTLALDITLDTNLKNEGKARELVNRIQNLRKEMGLEVTDRIELFIKSHAAVNKAVEANLDYICAETLAKSLEIVDEITDNQSTTVVFDENTETLISIKKVN